MGIEDLFRRRHKDVSSTLKEPEVPSLREGVQAFFVPSELAKKFGLKDHSREMTVTIPQIVKKLKEQGARLRGVVTMGGLDGGVVGLIILAEKYEGIKPQPNHEMNRASVPEIKVIVIESIKARKFFPSGIEVELTQLLDEQLAQLSDPAHLISVNTINSPSGGTTDLILCIEM